VENLMDPAHVPYAHKGLMGKLRKKEDPGRVEFDVEGGGPVKMKIAEADIAGFLSEQDNSGYFRYVAPCTFYGSPLPKEEKGQKFAVHALIWAGEEEEEAASVHAGVHVRPGVSREKQGDLGVPEERRRLARQGHTAVVLPHRPERHPGLRHLPPPHRGAQLRRGGHRKLAESRVCADVVGQHGDCLQELVQKTLQESGRLGRPDGRSATRDSNQRQAHGEVLVARHAVQELQRGAEGHEGAGGCPADCVGGSGRVPRRRQGDTGDIGGAESRRCVLGRAVLRRVPLAGELHREELLFPGLRPCLQVKAIILRLLLLGFCSS
uniref:Vanillate O-demethylase oxygenase-like C-terminal catalytic domain-containing protein n=1 Tax=Aegilops tauschii subsp. strangulata TaxID=200361 RepID=A0A453M5Q9_AEGTS